MKLARVTRSVVICVYLWFLPLMRTDHATARLGQHGRPDVAPSRAGPAAERARAGGVASADARSHSGGYLHSSGIDADRQAARGAWHRRQRLAVSRHDGGPLLAAVEPAAPGRAGVCHGQASG